MDRPSLLTTIRSWLRAGYPQGVPQSDYVPLLALLRRQLSDDEVAQVASGLLPARPVGSVEIAIEITKVTDELPRDEDVQRVRDRLAEHSWPFDGDPFGPSTPKDES
ncbi:DUF3349 domain-containing protein [Gordonia liuliyuniae]|uniref:DUF3349 domain-containing protein n=1 Tax=Gordonia liuliyuniae TaxID=2911517 RepID=A0ABS9IW16_9ACTN|nr:DUF3349 domain-containing protein [Gordonia liuliyuniae]MCF8589675.1 DUF3349 domain-containing protein [Gordonia liuliyuniae]